MHILYIVPKKKEIFPFYIYQKDPRLFMMLNSGRFKIKEKKKYILHTTHNKNMEFAITIFHHF